VTAFDVFEADGWERQAQGYDRFFGRITGRTVQPLLDAASVGAGDRVLDLATGPGYVAAAAAARGAQVVGIDAAGAMLAVAHERHPELEFRQANAEELPFADGSFDAAVANFLVLHLGRPERAAAEFARVLAPGGRLALTAWDVPEQARFLGVFLDAIAAAGAGAPPDLPTGPDFFRFSRDEEFASLLHGAGLEDVEVETIAFVQPVSSADHLWHGLLGGTVRTGALIVRQTPETQRRIRAEFDRLVAEYETGDGLELPVSVKLAAARKPGSPEFQVHCGAGVAALRLPGHIIAIEGGPPAMTDEERKQGPADGPEVARYAEEIEERQDAGDEDAGGSPSPGADQSGGTPGPTDELPGTDDPFPPGDDERAGTPTQETPDAGTDSGQEGPHVDVDTDAGTITFTSDHELSPEEQVAALESASEQFTDAAMTALHNLEDAEAGGDEEEIADARAQFKELAKGMTIVDQSVSDLKAHLKP
jgi:SAM-dependent methyltransferase